MQSLPYDMIPIIFGFILKITDKRMFSRTCKIYNNMTKTLIKNIVLKIVKNDKYNPYDEFLNDDIYCVEKFTLELCYDSYLNLMPMTYINPNNSKIVGVAIMSDNMNILQLAINNKCEISFCYCDLASAYGRLDMIKLLIENGTGWDSFMSSRAARYGHLNIIIWAKEKGFDINITHLFEIAIRCGHLNIVKWVIEGGDLELPCDGYRDGCVRAAEFGHLDMLIWFRDMGCVPTKHTYYMAKFYEHQNIVDWLENNGYPTH